MQQSEVEPSDSQKAQSVGPPESPSSLAVEASAEEYEMELRRELNLRQPESRAELKRRMQSFRDRILRSELADLGRDEAEIAAEQKSIIDANFWVSLAVTAIVLVAAILAGDALVGIADAISEFITLYLSWFYLLITTGLLVFLLLLNFSRYGNVVLGSPDEQPEFTTVSWLAMLFSAGMGVGILFYGCVEPMQHYLDPPLDTPASLTAARAAVPFSVFHWALHAWGVYTTCAAAIAYYGFRKGKRYLVSSGIIDLTPHPESQRIIKAATDIVATLAVIFGVAASLGLGIVQISSGFDYVFATDSSGLFGYATILLLLTGAFMGSSCTGLDQGIRLLSNLNVGVAVFLLLFVFFAGPTVFCLKLFVDSLGIYIQNLPEQSLRLNPFVESYETWMGDWTLNYFTWWIAWSPFVGIFIARISRGRTLRQLITGCLLVPAGFSVFWFAVFGGTAIYLQRIEGIDIGPKMLGDVSLSTFLLLDQLPLSGLTSFVTIVLLFTFLVTSADSATFVISMMTSRGNLDPPLRLKVFWGVVLAALTLVLVVGGGVDALQAATLVFAFPFAVVLVLMAFSLRFRLSIQVKERRI